MTPEEARSLMSRKKAPPKAAAKTPIKPPTKRSAAVKPQEEPPVSGQSTSWMHADAVCTSMTCLKHVQFEANGSFGWYTWHLVCAIVAVEHENKMRPDSDSIRCYAAGPEKEVNDPEEEQEEDSEDTSAAETEEEVAKRIPPRQPKTDTKAVHNPDPGLTEGQEFYRAADILQVDIAFDLRDPRQSVLL